MRQEQFTVPVGSAGFRFVRSYAPDAEDADRTLVIVHGVGEHSGRYEHFVRSAVARGWCVLAGDLQGHGQSDGVPTHLDDFDQYLADLDAIWSRFEIDPQRTALYGHSMGGLVCARYAETRPRSSAALVLSSPLLGFAIRVPPLKKTFGRVCLSLAPRFRFRSRIPESHITRNLEALQARSRDPLSNRTVTAGWYFRVLDALYDVWQEADRIQVPLLVLQGDADRIVNPEAPLGWLARVGSRDKSLRLLAGHLHELINEPGWQGTVAGVLDWLETRIAGRSRIEQPVAEALPLPARSSWTMTRQSAASSASGRRN